jgi:spore coat polysaccharide biosynthesis protein SpsF
LDVPVYRSSGTDPLGRVTAALEEYPAEGAVRICVHYPFVDPMLIDRLVTTADAQPQCDYVGYCRRNGRPAILSPVGMFAEWFRSTALSEAGRRATATLDRQMVTRYLYSHPEKFNLRLIPAPEQFDRDDVRLTVDIEEDWENALTIFDALGPEQLDWQRIAALLDQQPAMRRRMAVLNRCHATT